MSTEGVPEKGEIIAGKFQVEAVLGAGGMGVVVAARDLALRRRVAVKFLKPAVARLPEASARFLREARAAVAIQSEHVARVIDIGAMPDGSPYMVMEFLAGTDFSKVLKERGALPIPDAIDFVLQAGEAIAEAHALGIVHRDLKPGNLFLTSRAEGSPLVKVLDFGLSKMTLTPEGAPEGSLTATGFVAGSPFYMSPEQVRSLRDVDWRADIWALGVILYELLTAKRPFDGPSLTAVCASIIADTPAPMRSLRAEIPEAVERAVRGCLEKDVQKRARSVAELAEAIAPFAPAGSMGSVERIVRLVPGAATAPLAEEAEDSMDAAATLVLPSSGSGPVVAKVEAGQSTAVLGEAPKGAGAPVDQATSKTGQNGNWGQTSPGVRRAPIGWITAAVAGTAAVLGVVVWVLRSGDAAVAVPAGSSEPRIAASVAATAVVTNEPAPEPVAPAPTATVSASASAVVAAPPPPKAAAPKPIPKTVPPPKAAPAKPPAKKSILDNPD